MNTLEIVTQCWSGERAPIYHSLLQLQLTSILRNPSEVNVQVTVCCAVADGATTGVLLGMLDEFKPVENRTLNIIYMRPTQLWRRGNRAEPSRPADAC